VSFKMAYCGGQRKKNRVIRDEARRRNNTKRKRNTLLLSTNICVTIKVLTKLYNCICTY